MDFFTAAHGILLLTAVVFTVFGAYVGRRSQTEEIVEATLDSLIEDGYIKTEGRGANMEIIRWQEWCNKND
jgi:hypothetical protein